MDWQWLMCRWFGHDWVNVGGVYLVCRRCFVDMKKGWPLISQPLPPPPVSPDPEPDRIAWYRQQAEDAGEQAAWMMPRNWEDVDTTYHFARLAGHFGLLALEHTGIGRAVLLDHQEEIAALEARYEHLADSLRDET